MTADLRVDCHPSPEARAALQVLEQLKGQETPEKAFLNEIRHEFVDWMGKMIEAWATVEPAEALSESAKGFWHAVQRLGVTARSVTD